MLCNGNAKRKLTLMVLTINCAFVRDYSDEKDEM